MAKMCDTNVTVSLDNESKRLLKQLIKAVTDLKLQPVVPITAPGDRVLREWRHDELGKVTCHVEAEEKDD